MFIKTERLLLRPPWPEDAPAILAGINRWEIISNLGRAPWPYTLDDAETFIRMSTDAAEAAREHALVISLLPEARVVGIIGLIRQDCGAWELGYWLAQPLWGQGLVTEAATGLLDTGFSALGIERVVAGHYLDNPASGRVLTKLGFEPLGLAQRWCAGREADVPSQELGLRRAQWQEHAKRTYRASAPFKAPIAA
jgi:RimJ/RimL family protein N-acetyltransferase